MKGIQTRTYRERSQPASRAKLGLLEKKKDYIARARDFNAKKQRLKALAEKAMYKNPDEFYFKMTSSKTVKGVHKESREGKEYDEDVLKLMKSQDLAYVQLVKRKEEEKIKKMREEKHFGAESNEEIEQRKERLKKLQVAEKEMLLKKQLSGKGTKFQVGEDKDGVPIYKWKSIRSK